MKALTKEGKVLATSDRLVGEGIIEISHEENDKLSTHHHSVKGGKIKFGKKKTKKISKLEKLEEKVTKLEEIIAKMSKGEATE